jgi:transcriptional regulator with XRE-family HTH domain
VATKISGRRFTHEESVQWIADRMLNLGIANYEELAELVGIDRGSLSRYFRQERRPSIDVIAPLCTVLQVAPETLLIALGAIDS